MKRNILVLLMLLFISSVSVVAQTQTVTGQVTASEDGSPLPGVNIVERGTNNGTVTDVDGNYSLTVGSDAVLVFTFVGFAAQEIPVSGQTAVDVALAADVLALNEVVIVGYGEQRREDITGSVTEIGAEDFNRGVIGSPQDLLVGRMAGVQITSAGGAPGSNSTIRIRGGSSLSASNDPLIIIDGFPVDNANISGLSNPLSSLNPNDIESFTVLKDASATAIYGSRASNGVIIITTKKGADGKIQLGYNGNVSLSTPIKFVDVFSGDEFRALATRLAEQGAVGLNAQALERLGSENTDWQKEIYRNGISHDHNVSVGGTLQNIPYRFSYGFTDQEGILKTTGMTRHTFNVNVNPRFFDDHLTINASVKSMLINTNFGNQEAVGAAVSFDPTQPIRNGNTRYGGYFAWVNLSDTLPNGAMNPNGGANTLSINNPVALLNLTDNQSDVTRTIGNIQLDYRFHFLEDLRVNLNVGIDQSNGEGYNNAAPQAAWTYRNFTSGTGQLINYTNDNRSRLLELYFNYTKEVGKGSIDATAGYSWQHFEREGTNYNRSGDETQVIENSRFLNENYLVSFFGRFQYSLLDRYIFTATLRNDGSSRFADENQWGLFPALAVAWNVSEEPFLQAVQQLSTLKIRASYGITGQQDIASNQYPALAIYRGSIGGAAYQFGNEYVQTLRPDPYDVDIKWEETTTLNIGADFGFAEDRFGGTIDVYRRTTEDLINFIPIAAGSNFSNFLTTNVGNLENRGIELTLRARAVQKTNMTWDVGFNFTHNVNEITKLTKTDDPNYPGVDVGAIGGGVGNFIQNQRVGFPANSFYVFQQVYDAQGNPVEGLYADRTGEGGEVTSNNLNKYHYHSPAPNVLMGINSNMRYGNFDFTFSGRFSFGNYVYNNIASGNTFSSVYVQSGFFGNVRSSINETNFTNPQYWSDYFVENASFFKMDNISVGYNFNQFNTEKLKARVSFTVQNAFTVTNYSGLDPEVSSEAVTNNTRQVTSGIDNNIYPRPRVFVLGVNFTY
jgi:iron complex outermembrane receptor protein